MRAKNKTLFLLIMGFVFLFSASWLHSGFAPKITAEEISDVKQAQAELVLVTTSSEKDLEGGALKVDLFNTQLSTEKAHTGSEAEPLHEVSGSATLQGGELKEEYYKVVKVVDGDTIDVDINGKTERLRLIGINTPEVVDPRKPVECFGREASNNSHELLDGAEVKIVADSTQDNRDKYGRLLRYVWRRDGLFYNLEAIKGGFAFEYTYQIPYQYQKDFKAAQKYAEYNKLGFWADGACEQKNISTVKHDSTVVLAPADKNCVIKGNISFGGSASAKATADEVKIYHLPGCSYYKQTVINESNGEKWFCTEDEAIAAGWRKAGNCP